MWKTNLLIPFLIINFSLLFTELGDFKIQLLKGKKNFNFTGTSPPALDIFRNLLDNNIWVSPDMEIMLSLKQINSSLQLSDNDFVLKAFYRYTSKKKKKSYLQSIGLVVLRNPWLENRMINWLKRTRGWRSNWLFYSTYKDQYLFAR